MKTQVSPFHEKRQFERIEIPESIVCKIYIPQSQKLWGNQGKIKNISLGGIYFTCDEKPPLEKNDIRHLIIDALYNEQKLYRLEFHGLVVRIEKRGSQFGVAVKFLADHIYYPNLENKTGHFLGLDKNRILNQHFQLYKKAYEIIKKAPDLRNKKVKNIKERIDQNLYEIHTKDVMKIFRAI